MTSKKKRCCQERFALLTSHVIFMSSVTLAIVRYSPTACESFNGLFWSSLHHFTDPRYVPCIEQCKFDTDPLKICITVTPSSRMVSTFSSPLASKISSETSSNRFFISALIFFNKPALTPCGVPTDNAARMVVALGQQAVAGDTKIIHTANVKSVL